MTTEYIDAVIETLKDDHRMKERTEELKSEVERLSFDALSYTPALRTRRDCLVRLLRSGREVGTVFCMAYTKGEGSLDLEVTAKVQRLSEGLDRDEEILSTIRTILARSYKAEVLKSLPSMKDVFDRTEARIEEERKADAERSRALRRDIEAFLAEG